MKTARVPGYELVVGKKKNIENSSNANRGCGELPGDEILSKPAFVIRFAVWFL